MSYDMILGVFGNDEFLKVWKGLHYCLWMTDKPLIQVFMRCYGSIMLIINY